MLNPSSNEIFMKIHLTENESNFQKFEKELKNSLFYLFFLLSKEAKSNLFIESISLIFQYLQIMYYPFNSYVKYFI